MMKELEGKNLDQTIVDIYGNDIKRTALLIKARMPWADLDELLQLGAIGMMEAVARFSVSKGVDFRVFAARRIRGAMIDGLRREGRQRRGRVEVEELENVKIDEEDGGGLTPLSGLVEEDNMALIEGAIKSLSEIENRVLMLHYYEDLNNREISKILGVSEGYASKIKKSALGKIAIRVNDVMQNRSQKSE
ncbi:sigma-70 family RNA polymerase sigma factor [Acidocella sp.]|uniref:sigma-70 family RNA polymerase sigma factor n=1 Tax=Acidocella sp. TaxID=50710 RepID=UPI002630CBED|nr:sigma-70 family RNA polymerase sigma factor [Acidocella sp.]